jgi:hypothetical protein
MDQSGAGALAHSPDAVGSRAFVIKGLGYRQHAAVVREQPEPDM